MSKIPRSSDLVLQNKSHEEMVYNNRYYEKFFIINDDCDGIVWEKQHPNSLMINTCYWYPGSYSNWVYTHCLLSGNSEGFSYVCEQGLPGDRIYRSNKYLIAIDSLWYYKDYINFRYSPDGFNWYPNTQEVPGSWGQPSQGWAKDSDTGIAVGRNRKGVNAVWSIKLEDGKPPIVTKIADIEEGRSYNGYLGNYVSHGWNKKESYGEGEDPNITYAQYTDIHGVFFTSSLPGNYQWTDLGEDDPSKRIKYANYNWRVEYFDGMYYATAKQDIIRYYNEVKQEWQTMRKMIMVRSTNCFQTISVTELENPCPDNHFQDWIVWNGGIFAVKDEDKWQGFRDKVVVPLVGNTGDDSHDCVIVNINDESLKNVTETTIFKDGIRHNAYVRQIDWDGIRTAVSIVNGSPSSGNSILMPTGFKPNGWSYNSYNTAGFIQIAKISEDASPVDDQYNMAWFCNDNYMIDKGNATWGEDGWFFQYNLRGYLRLFDNVVLNESYGYNRHSYTIPRSADLYGVFRTKFHNRSRITCELQIGNPGYYTTTKYRTRTLRRGRKTIFDFSAYLYDYHTDSPYYICQDEEHPSPLISHEGHQWRMCADSETHEGFDSKSYCFVVCYKWMSWYSWYYATAPLMISSEEFDPFYQNADGSSKTGIGDVEVYEFFGRTWYVTGLKNGISGKHPECDRYVDMSYLDNTNDRARREIVYQCLKMIYDPEE